MSPRPFPLFLRPLAVAAVTITAVSLFVAVLHRQSPASSQPMAARSFVLWLHGLGDSGPANEPIRTFFSSPEFRLTKWSFPSAPQSPVSCNHGAVMPSWFDIYEIPVTALKLSQLSTIITVVHTRELHSDFTNYQESPKDENSVLKAVQTVHAMIEKEVANGVSPENIFICGFSQGGIENFATY
ncbi:hypothetical protein BHM03_00062071 [Ensete ventricosum]|nr:hypothetical protein BHM03_00062071 [Ensete ventricosum]